MIIKSMSPFIIYQLMYTILDALNDENESENLVAFLTDTSPYMHDDENSFDIVIYNDFRKKFLNNNDKRDYCYNFICQYLKSLDYYNDIYKIFKSITKQQYIDTCDDIIKNDYDKLKHF